MARRKYESDYRSFYKIVTIIITAIVMSIKFLFEVNKRGLWKECIISVSIIFTINSFIYLLTQKCSINSDYFLISLLVTFISFCVYWWITFKNNPWILIKIILDTKITALKSVLLFFNSVRETSVYIL